MRSRTHSLSLRRLALSSSLLVFLSFFVCVCVCAALAPEGRKGEAKTGLVGRHGLSELRVGRQLRRKGCSGADSSVSPRHFPLQSGSSTEGTVVQELELGAGRLLYSL